MEAERTIRSLLSQSVPPDEIIVIDDASTDDSLSRLRRLAEAHASVRVIPNNEHRQVPYCVTQGVKIARGEFILLCSANDRHSTDAIERYLGVLRRFPHARMVISRNGDWNSDDDTLVDYGRSSERGLWYLEPSEFVAEITPERLHRLLSIAPAPLMASTALVRRTALLEVGVYRSELQWHSDWFALHAIAFRYGFCVLDAGLCWNRTGASSYSSRGMRDWGEQGKVVQNLINLLHDPEFKDLRTAIERSPAAAATFMRQLLPLLAMRPRYYRMFVKVLKWWLLEFMKGNRPAALMRLSEQLGRGKKLRPVL